ncbi:MAG: hypothetical protein GY738_30725, partial [Pseudoalteromonas sp.]|nr:hypothetical protein [Pseudoalteromonas sp.]
SESSLATRMKHGNQSEAWSGCNEIAAIMENMQHAPGNQNQPQCCQMGTTTTSTTTTTMPTRTKVSDRSVVVVVVVVVASS